MNKHILVLCAPLAVSGILAAGSVVFTNCYSTTNSTLLSHTSMFTSLCIRDHGVLHNRLMVPEIPWLMPPVFKRNRYRTAAFTSGEHLNPVSRINQGFDDFFNPEQAECRSGETNAVIRKWLTVLGYSQPDKPLGIFMWLHYFDPHALTGIIGIYPSVMELTGLAAPAPVRGKTLAGIMVDLPAPGLRDAAYYQNVHKWLAGMTTGDFSYMRLIYNALKHELIEDPQGTVELYDVINDRGQTKSVLSGHPDVAARMGAKLAGFFRDRITLGRTERMTDPEQVKKFKALGYLQ